MYRCRFCGKEVFTICDCSKSFNNKDLWDKGARAAKRKSYVKFREKLERDKRRDRKCLEKE